jgi:hypothetical protein
MSRPWRPSLLAAALALLGCESPPSSDDTDRVRATSGALSTSFALDRSAALPGQKVTGTLVYTNHGASSITFQSIVIAGRPPGGTHAGGPYDDFAPQKSAVTLAPGASLTLVASRTLGAGDALGTWESYPTYRDSQGWHDGPSHFFVVANAPPPDMAPPSAGLAVTFALDQASIGAGGTITGTVTYTNHDLASVSMQELVIAGRPPGGTHSGGPYDDFSPSASSLVIPAGGAYTLVASRSFTSSDPSGTWESYPTYRDASGWHDGPSQHFIVGNAPAPDLGTGSPPPDMAAHPDLAPPPAPVDMAMPPSNPGAKFTTLPPGTPLPSDAECAARVRRNSWEPRPDNAAANNNPATSNQVNTYVTQEPWGVNAHGQSLQSRISGNFTGTTDEILQWSACKWGIDEDIVRAQAVTESTWHQSTRGDYSTNQADCPPGTFDGTGCYQSYGILQMKYKYWGHSVWPLPRDSTAFNADTMRGWWRACYEGDITWVSGSRGDLWNCIGLWYSGSFGSGASGYISTTQGHLAAKPWVGWGYPGP